MRTAEFGLVDVLPASAAGAHGVDADFLGLDVELDVLGLGQHGNGGGGGVDATAGLGGRHALHAVHARFEFEPCEHALPGDGRDDLLVAAEIVLRDTDDLGLPAVQIGIAAIHAEQVGCEQGRLVAAGAGAHFQNGALLVGGILGEQLQAQLLLERRNTRAKRGLLVPGHGRKLLVGRRVGLQGGKVGTFGLGLAQRADGGDQRTQVRKLLGKLCVIGLVDALGQFVLQELPALQHLIELLGRDGGHLRGHA